MSQRFTIVIDGIDDPALVADIEKTIRESFHQLALPGAWRVEVSPSQMHGRWDFRLYGLDVRHTMSIAVPPNLLSTLIPRRFRDALDPSAVRMPNGVRSHITNSPRSTTKDGPVVAQTATAPTIL